MEKPELLDHLSPLVERARAYADRWPAEYKADVFRAALRILLDFEGGELGAAENGGLSRMDGSLSTVRRRPAPHVGQNLLFGQSAARPTSGAKGSADKLARSLGVEIDAVDRTVHIDEDGRIAILGRVDGKTRKELQTKYSLVYLYVKEIALASRMVDVEDLRAVCVEHGCYDPANFTSNYRKDVTAGLIREDAKGARNRRYMLTQKGLAEGAALLGAMVAQ
jgi:hypothetical protein